MEESQENKNEEVAESSSEQNKNSSGLLLVGLAFLGIILVGGYLLMSSRSKTSSTTNMVTTPTVLQEESMTNEEIPAEGNNDAETSMLEEDPNVINVEGGSFYFKPNIIKAKVGVPVKIKFTSVGGMPHDFVVDELGVKTEQIADDTLEFEFTPTQSGTFEFYCSVGSHRKMGMKGSLIVEE